LLRKVSLNWTASSGVSAAVVLACRHRRGVSHASRDCAEKLSIAGVLLSAEG